MGPIYPWIHGLLVLLTALLSAKLGEKLCKTRGYSWLWGYFLPMGMILVFGVTRSNPELKLQAPWNWVTTGKAQFAVVTPVTALLFATLAAKLPKASERRALGVFAAVIIATASLWPLVAPAFNHRYLLNLSTRFDNQGICLQSTDYTCGPAAAVTALRRLGIQADEGALAVLAGTSTACGTPPDILSTSLQESFSAQGLESRLAFFKSVEELPRDGITLAVIKFGFLVDHYVAVLEIHPSYLLVGDPAVGMRRIDRNEFEKIWKKTGVVVHRN